MPEQWLVRLEIAHIQQYVFASEKLRELVGGSYLVRQATEEWPKTLIGASGRMVAGGGRMLALISGDESARKEFTGKLSMRILQEAPGMTYLFGWAKLANGDLRAAMDDTQRQVLRRKLSGAVSGHLDTMPVSVRCASSGAAASNVDRSSDGHPPVSSAVVHKIRVAAAANASLETSVGPLKGDKFPLDFEKLGRSFGEYSYVGVVHIDGNAMGQRIRNVLDASTDVWKSEEDLTASIERAGREALKDLVAWVQELVRSPDSGDWLKLESTNEGGGKVLPIRPIVYGGDDTTFVCDGRIALAAAVKYLESFENYIDADSGETRPRLFTDSQQFTASAGVAIIKSHYPFSRAYELAEQLLSSAKGFAQGVSGTTSGAGYPSALDWQIAATGIHQSLKDARRQAVRERKPEGEEQWALSTTPLSLNRVYSVRNWDSFSSVVREFRERAAAGERSRQYPLFEALANGPVACKRFLAKSKLTLPEWPLQTYPGVLESGFDDKRCFYFDALEISRFVPDEVWK